MHTHHVLALAAELRRPEYAGLSADAAFALITTRPPQTGEPGKLVNTQTAAEKRLTRLRFVGETAFAAMPEKRRTQGAGSEFWFPVPDGMLEPFKDCGVPGSPGTVRRDLFDAAWEAR